MLFVLIVTSTYMTYDQSVFLLNAVCSNVIVDIVSNLFALVAFVHKLCVLDASFAMYCVDYWDRVYLNFLVYVLPSHLHYTASLFL